MPRPCNHVQMPPSKSGLYTIEIHDKDGNELQVEHLSYFKCDTDMPLISLTVEPKQAS